MLHLLPHPRNATTCHEPAPEPETTERPPPSAGMTVRDVGWFWAVCDARRYHRVTASRVIVGSPHGYQAVTRLSLPGGSEVSRVWAGVYAPGIGTLRRVGWVEAGDD